MNQFLSRGATLASARRPCQVPSFLLLRNARSGYFPPMRKIMIWPMICAWLALSFPAPASEPPEPPNTEDAAFNSLVDEYLTGYLKWRPLLATSLGFHQYAGKLTDFSKVSIDLELSRLKAFARLITELDTTQLSRQAFYDLLILRGAVNREIFSFEQ